MLCSFWVAASAGMAGDCGNDGGCWLCEGVGDHKGRPYVVLANGGVSGTWEYDAEVSE